MNRAARLLARVIDYGTETHPKSVARRLRQVNWFNLFLVLAYLVFAAFYALVDWKGLKLLSAAIVAAVPFFFLTPFFHRLGDAAASTYLVFHLTNSFLVFSVIVGTAAGVRYWLLAAGEARWRSKAKAKCSCTIWWTKPETPSRAMLLLVCDVRYIVEETARNDLAAIALQQFERIAAARVIPIVGSRL